MTTKTNTYKLVSLLSVAMIIATFTSALQAATAPSTGKTMQENAPEKIGFLVLESQTVLVEKVDLVNDNILVTAKVRVTSVSNTKSGLKVGQVIEISYGRHTEEGRPPGSWPRLVEVGIKYKSYMKAAGKHYVPVAASYSFIK